MDKSSDAVKLSSAQIVAFLEAYQKYESLWDASSPNYLKKDYKCESLRNLLNDLLGEGLNVNEQQLKNKIKSIRDTYRNELKKVQKSKKSGIGGGDVYKPKLAWFAAADFLRNVFLGRESSSNLVSKAIF